MTFVKGVSMLAALCTLTSNGNVISLESDLPYDFD